MSRKKSANTVQHGREKHAPDELEGKHAKTMVDDPDRARVSMSYRSRKEDASKLVDTSFTHVHNRNQAIVCEAADLGASDSPKKA